MHHGTAWYPEHTGPETWERDLALMREARMTVVRVAEFAWSRLEPSDGRFALDWFARAVDAAHRQGLAVVIGTPTAAPPAWLTQAHPETLRVEPNGRVCIHGARGHYNPANATYLRFCERIADRLAERFAAHPAVIGWQIDNEYWPFSWDAETRRQFQAWLQRRYGTLDELNRRWSCAYWSQDYGDWAQVPLATEWQNPCLVAALRAFQVEVVARYQRVQVDAIRRHVGARHWITHNFHSTYEHADASVLCRDLDLASFDPYVGSGHLDHEEMGFRLDWTRGLKRGPFWIMETQPGHVNWSRLNNALDRGEARRMAWHQVGHGAEAVLWWQWRPARGGQEQFHGSLVDAGGRPRPFHAEAAAIGADLAAAAPALAGTRVRARAAILASWDDRHSLDTQRHHADYDAMRLWREWHAALRRLGLDVDVVRPDEDLAQYALCLAPQLHLVDDALCRRLVDWTRSGGHLVVGPRSGVKDRDNALLTERAPGAVLAEACGAEVVEYYALEGAVALAGEAGVGRCAVWGEWLEPRAEDAAVVLRYGDEHSWLAGQAALVERPCGAGRIALCGCWPDQETRDRLAERWCRAAGLRSPWGRLPPGVEASCREGSGRRVHVLCNHGIADHVLLLAHPVRDVLTGETHGGVLRLGGRAVAVLEERG